MAPHARFGVALHHAGWTDVSHAADPEFRFPDPARPATPFVLSEKGVVCAEGRTALETLSNGVARLSVSVVSMRDQRPEALVLALVLDAPAHAGHAWRTDEGAAGTFPAVFKDRVVLCSGVTRGLALSSPSGGTLRLSFPVPVRVLVQDDRKWCGTFTVRVSDGAAPFARPFPKGETRRLVCDLSSPQGVSVHCARPVVVRAGPDWIPFDAVKDVAPGGAFDFSRWGALRDAPAGKHGWLRVVDGHFAFEKAPEIPRRFFGVNLCFSANFPDDALAAQLVARLARLGYNAVRIHHYDGAQGLVRGSPDRLSLDPGNAARLDGLLAKCFASGIYATTDLFTSRPVAWRDVAVDRAGFVPMQVYKALVAVHAPAFENWKTFARNFLLHENPFTHRRYVDEPGLPLIALVNEGTLSWCWDEVKREAPMRRRWAAWLDARRRADPSFAPGVSTDAVVVVSWKQKDALAAFAADVEADLARRQRAFLRDLGCKALLTSQNGCVHAAAFAPVRAAAYDYVDDHFYVDHPRFLARPWRLPSSCANVNPVCMPDLPPVSCAFVRQVGRPFVITEWNFSGPGQYRGVGGLLTGAMAALQNWDGLWRFAYSHGADNLHDRVGAPGYFDLASDPLAQAAERLSFMLFMRGDLPPLSDALVQTLPAAPSAFSVPAAASLAPKWRDAAWCLRVATAVGAPPPGIPACAFAATRDSAVVPSPPGNSSSSSAVLSSFSAVPSSSSAVPSFSSVVAPCPSVSSPSSGVMKSARLPGASLVTPSSSASPPSSPVASSASSPSSPVVSSVSSPSSGVMKSARLPGASSGASSVAPSSSVSPPSSPVASSVSPPFSPVASSASSPSSGVMKSARLPGASLGASSGASLAPACVLDRARGTVRLATPRTAGGFAPAGRLEAGPLAFDVGAVPATVWASALDDAGAALPCASRVLVVHLTDVQGDGTVYADAEKTTLLKWGAYPPVVRKGSARIALVRERPECDAVWALDAAGRRTTRLPAIVENGRLVFTCCTDGGSRGARLAYEITRQSQKQRFQTTDPEDSRRP